MGSGLGATPTKPAHPFGNLVKLDNQQLKKDSEQLDGFCLTLADSLASTGCGTGGDVSLGDTARSAAPQKLGSLLPLIRAPRNLQSH